MAYIMGAQGDSMFVKGAAKLVFGRKNLQMRRSVTREPYRRFKRVMPKKAPTPAKVEAVSNAFHKYVERNPREKSPTKSIPLINDYLRDRADCTGAACAGLFWDMKAAGEPSPRREEARCPWVGFGVLRAAARSSSKTWVALDSIRGAGPRRATSAYEPCARKDQRFLASRTPVYEKQGPKRCIASAGGAPKGPNVPRVKLNRKDPLFPGHGYATHSQTWVGEPTWLGVSVEHIKALVEIDAARDLKLAPHLKSSYLDPSHFKKMNVASSAVAVLNHSVWAAMRVLVCLGLLPPEAITTTWFVEQLLVKELLRTTISTVFLFKVLPRSGVDAADKARHVQLNRRLARGVRQMSDVVLINPDVFFPDKKQPRRDHCVGDGYHISHLLGVRVFTRLIKVQVVRRLGAEWGETNPGSRQKRYREHLGSLEKGLEEDRSIERLKIPLEERSLATEKHQIERGLAIEERQPQPLDADHHYGKDQKDNAPDMHQIGVLKSPSFAKAGHEVSQLAV
ncbi:hypothetical protein HPB47_018725 [Ixodes persulcatus]|uniref:Uncharacterized protein n=1 Tax=Ixodes persulcatus TaxID=34615 RepID=A0AC60R0L5_IXOPE|nr:hypothetical protein HPB47_018725 [Ixodes persulcatus]